MSDFDAEELCGWKHAKQHGDAEEKYRQAVEEGGSIYGAAKILSVSRATVRDQMKRYDIPNPQTGEVPGSDYMTDA